MGAWIPLLVPREDYLEIARIVQARAAERGGSGLDDPELVVALDESDAVQAAEASRGLAGFEPWRTSDLRRLAASSAVTATRWARALDVCADHVGEFLSTKQVAEESGMTVNEWRDAPRKISRHLKANYPYAPSWPLAARGGRELGINDDQVYWAISDEQAKRWREVRGGAR